MLSSKTLGYAALVWLVCTLFCVAIEGTMTFFDTNNLNILNALTGYNVVTVSGAGVWAIPKLAVGFVTVGIPKMILWNYPFFDGGYFIVRAFLFVFLSIPIIWGFTQAFIGVAQGILQRFTGT
jgi:hypothetical protein